MRFAWKRPGGLPECPYFHYWAAMFGPFSIRVHLWHADDDSRAYHDHPHWLLIWVWRGAYTDISPAKDGSEVRDRLTRWSLRYRAAAYQHKVQEVVPGTVTILLTGRSDRRWGFWVNGKLIKRDKYFATMGHHPCDVGMEPVRMRPDKTRIT